MWWYQFPNPLLARSDNKVSQRPSLEGRAGQVSCLHHCQSGYSCSTPCSLLLLLPLLPTLLLPILQPLLLLLLLPLPLLLFQPLLLPLLLPLFLFLFLILPLFMPLYLLLLLSLIQPLFLPLCMPLLLLLFLPLLLPLLLPLQLPDKEMSVLSGERCSGREVWRYVTSSAPPNCAGYYTVQTLAS